MPNVIIDGVVYVPKCEIPVLTDERLKEALGDLVAIQYFDEEHKNRAIAWDVLNALAPDIAAISANNPKHAYEIIHGVED